LPAGSISSPGFSDSESGLGVTEIEGESIASSLKPVCSESTEVGGVSVK